MPPTRSVSPNRRASPAVSSPQSPEVLAALIEGFFADHADALVVDEGRVIFDLKAAKWTVSCAHGHCTVHLWSEERNLVRRITGATRRQSALRLTTQRLGHTEPTVMELCPAGERRLPSSRDAARERYLGLLQRVLAREFAPWEPTGFRAAMDLERSFGPAYVRGSLVRGRDAWAVIGVGAQETVSTIEGVLTPGILWLHECRARAGGRRLYTGLRIIAPKELAGLTHSRLPWLNTDAARWELLELNEADESLLARDPDDQGNLRTALVQRPDEEHARVRFAEAVERVRALVPTGEWSRVEQHLRSPTELVFLLHGLQFARARVMTDGASFKHRVEISVGAGAAERMLPTADPVELEFVREAIAELFQRRRAAAVETDFGARGLEVRDLEGRDLGIHDLGGRGDRSARRIGSGVLGAAHRRTLLAQRNVPGRLPPAQDPLFRAAPERWLESVLRADLAPLTRSSTAQPGSAQTQELRASGPTAVPEDPDTRGNRATSNDRSGGGEVVSGAPAARETSHLIPRLNPQHVYAQVPAIAGASDRGLLDLLGMTDDGRLAVIELKTEDDLHLALQGLDYWIRVRHHHAAVADMRTGLGEFQRHGYFKDVELSPEPPRLYLVAPALHIHPATETILRYLSPRVEWHLLALDERWRQSVRVVWRRSNVRA